MTDMTDVPDVSDVSDLAACRVSVSVAALVCCGIVRLVCCGIVRLVCCRYQMYCDEDIKLYLNRMSRDKAWVTIEHCIAPYSTV